MLAFVNELGSNTFKEVELSKIYSYKRIIFFQHSAAKLEMKSIFSYLNSADILWSDNLKEEDKIKKMSRHLESTQQRVKWSESHYNYVTQQHMRLIN